MGSLEAFFLLKSAAHLAIFFNLAVELVVVPPHLSLLIRRRIMALLLLWARKRNFKQDVVAKSFPFFAAIFLEAASGCQPFIEGFVRDFFSSNTSGLHTKQHPYEPPYIPFLWFFGLSLSFGRFLARARRGKFFERPATHLRWAQAAARSCGSSAATVAAH
ncbi:MAG: hypothetical protein NZM41_13605 [Saprospiraceae bacterium]|nr:hypothetical protein [Saprospiraceae bacterium]